jgi:hypothetical protein
VDTAKNKRAALDKLLEGDRDQISDRRKDDRGIGRLPWGLVRPAGPFATQRTGKLLSLAIIGAREGKDPPAVMQRDLGHDMCRGTKAEDRSPRRIIRYARTRPVLFVHDRSRRK